MSDTPINTGSDTGSEFAPEFNFPIESMFAGALIELLAEYPDDVKVVAIAREQLPPLIVGGPNRKGEWVVTILLDDHDNPGKEKGIKTRGATPWEAFLVAQNRVVGELEYLKTRKPIIRP